MHREISKQLNKTSFQNIYEKCLNRKKVDRIQMMVLCGVWVLSCLIMSLGKVLNREVMLTGLPTLQELERFFRRN